MIVTASATSKYIKIAPTKINKLISKIRGKTYREALYILKAPQNNATAVWKTLYSAVSNAVNNYKLKKENIIILEAFVNQGTIVKKVHAKAKGKASKIEKKMSHIFIKVGGEITLKKK